MKEMFISRNVTYEFLVLTESEKFSKYRLRPKFASSERKIQIKINTTIKYFDLDAYWNVHSIMKKDNEFKKGRAWSYKTQIKVAATLDASVVLSFSFIIWSILLTWVTSYSRDTLNLEKCGTWLDVSNQYVGAQLK